MLPTHLTQETENSLFTILQSYALLLKNMLETVTVLFPDFSYLTEKYDLPKKQLNAISLCYLCKTSYSHISRYCTSRGFINKNCCICVWFYSGRSCHPTEKIVGYVEWSWPEISLLPWTQWNHYETWPIMSGNQEHVKKKTHTHTQIPTDQDENCNRQSTACRCSYRIHGRFWLAMYCTYKC